MPQLPSSPLSNQAVVIGASAAGLHTATLLARGGMPVLLFDQQERFQPLARTLIVTPRLREALGGVPRAAVVNATPVLQMFSPGASATVRLAQADWVVERETLMPWLLLQARQAGVEFLSGYRYQGVEPDHGGVYVRLESPTGRLERVRTGTLIGADGVGSQVARAVYAQDKPFPTVYNLQATLPLPRDVTPDTTQIWFDPALTRYFFWLIPSSPQRAVLGLVADDEAQARRSLARFLGAHAWQPLSYQGAAVPLYAGRGLPVRQVHGAQVYLVGDAAGQVKVTTVGGLVTGLRGAGAAARAILRRTGLGRELRALQRELEGHRLIRGVLNRFGPQEYDELLRLLNARARQALAVHTRDEALRVLAASLAAQPRFVWLAARSLLRRARVDHE